MKTEFYINTHDNKNRGGSKLTIIGKKPESKPYLSFKIGQLDPFGYIQDKELEQLAVNILRALDSKYLNNKP